MDSISSRVGGRFNGAAAADDIPGGGVYVACWAD